MAGDGERPQEARDGSDWAAYYQHTLGREPRPLFARGMAALAAADVRPGRAIEIGFGDGTETLALLAAGWRVTAIDPAPSAADVLGSRVPQDLAGSLDVVTVPAEQAALPTFDLLYAGYTLPFLDARALDTFWAGVRAQVAPGGFLVFNLFGEHDTWMGNPEMTFHRRPAVDRMVAGLDVIVLDEIEEDGMSFLGPKHWHTFDVIARHSAPGA